MMRQKLQFTHPGHRQRGVGIIEVLVALVVVSLGVLGMANLQLKGIKHSSSGYNRSKALMVAENITSRMRANRAGVLAGSYNAFTFTSTATTCAVKPNPYCEASGTTAAQSCTVAELAAFDRFSASCGSWGATESASGGIQDYLPIGSNISVNCDDATCTPTSTYTVAVTWPEGQNASSATVANRSVTIRFRP